MSDVRRRIKKFFNRGKKATTSVVKRQIVGQDVHGINRDYVSRNAIKVVLQLQEAGFEAYVVGGCVRDALMGVRPKDFDVATSATPEEVRGLFRNSRIIGRRFRLVHVLFGREVIETATFRAPASEHGDDHRTSDTGRVLRDNVYGSLEDDAVRRDFTCNALYYDPSDQTVHDFVGGIEDLQAKQICMIGDPVTRYREDPVRMIRAVRFADKLGCEIEPASETPIFELAGLMSDIPAARLFDEILKLLQTGRAVSTFEKLDHYGLFDPLFPLTAPLLTRDDDGKPNNELKLLLKSLANTDKRIKQRKPVTPAFLFAALLWAPVKAHAKKLRDSGVPPAPAMSQAISEVASQQAQHISIPKRFGLPMREIWALQHRFEQRRGNRPLRLLEHPKFRAAYDFLLLRAYAGEVPHELADWWTEIQDEDDEQRETRIQNAPADTSHGGVGTGPKKRRRKRKRKPAGERGEANGDQQPNTQEAADTTADPQATQPANQTDSETTAATKAPVENTAESAVERTAEKAAPDTTAQTTKKAVKAPAKKSRAKATTKATAKPEAELEAKAEPTAAAPRKPRARKPKTSESSDGRSSTGSFPSPDHHGGGGYRGSDY